jgi:hypothetical protein
VAHGHPPAAPRADAVPTVWLGLAVVVALAGVAALGRRGGRGGLAAGLTVALLVLASQSALHSVHHLGEPQAERACPVAAATGHVPGVSAAPSTLGTPVTIAAPAVALPIAWRTPLPPVRAREGRAPPAPLSA